jgi:hypothetical protein
VAWAEPADCYQTMLSPGLTNSTVFTKIHQNLADSVRTELKKQTITVHKSKFLKNKKIRKSTIKTRVNSKHFGEEKITNLHHLVG